MDPINTVLYDLAKNIIDHVAAEKTKLGAGHLAEETLIELVQDILKHTLHAKGFVRVEPVIPRAE